MQYQFILDNLKESDQIQSELTSAGIKSSDIHFVTENSGDFAGHHVNAASILEERDVIHSGIRWGMVGCLAGLLVALIVDMIQPYGWKPELINTLLFVLLGSGFGAWIGGLIGISHRNYRISQFEEQLQCGKAIMLVYSDEKEEEHIKSMVLSNHPHARYGGHSASYDNPLDNSKTVELED